MLKQARPCYCRLKTSAFPKCVGVVGAGSRGRPGCGSSRGNVVPWVLSAKLLQPLASWLGAVVLLTGHPGRMEDQARVVAGLLTPQSLCISIRLEIPSRLYVVVSRHCRVSRGPSGRHEKFYPRFIPTASRSQKKVRITAMPVVMTLRQWR